MARVRLPRRGDQTGESLIPSETAPSDCIVVGGGAAGLMAAIMAARGGARVLVLDGASRLGAKILISGGGRCNVTNRIVTAADFWGGSRSTIARVLGAWTVDDTVRFFADAGVALHEEARGKLFPDANRSRVVLDALLAQARAAGVAIETGWRVDQVTDDGERFTVAGERGEYQCDRVVLTSGGRSVPKTGSTGGGYALARALGHELIDATPALVPLLLDAGMQEHVAGVTADVEIAVVVDGRVAVRTGGPLLWTHVGVSGPAVLDASRHWHRARLEDRQVELRVSFRPGRQFDAIDRDLADAARERPRATLDSVLSDWVPASLAQQLRVHAGVPDGVTMAHLAREDRRKVAHALSGLTLAIRGSRGFEVAEATAGGVPLTEVDPVTMASRVRPGLYLAGEILDVDGRLGGFNFQWAWASGAVAGRAVAAATLSHRR